MLVLLCGYTEEMTLPQCKAIVLYGRDRSGNRAGLMPPRHCQRVAREGKYCGLHNRQAELQDLLADCLSPIWEVKVKLWQERQRKKEVDTGRELVKTLAALAQRADMAQLSRHLTTHRRDFAEAWADGAG